MNASYFGGNKRMGLFEGSHKSNANDELAFFLLVDGHVRGIPHFQIHPTLCHLIEGTIAGNTRTYEKKNIVSCSIRNQLVNELTKSVVHIGPLDLKDGQKGLTWYVKP